MMRSKASYAAIMLVTLTAPPASGTEPITAANWRHHPAIVEIRAIYRKVQHAKAAGALRKEVRTFGYCRYQDGERCLYLDAVGAARSYHVGRGSDDSAVETTSYYDWDETLRFVFA